MFASLLLFAILIKTSYYKQPTMPWKWIVAAHRTPGINSVFQRRISLSIPLAILFPSHSSPDTHLCSKYLTYSPLRLANWKITYTEKVGWLHCWSTDEKKNGTAELKCLLNRLYNSDVFKPRQTEKEVLTCFRSHLLMVKRMLCSWWFSILLSIHHSTYAVCRS